MLRDKKAIRVLQASQREARDYLYSLQDRTTKGVASQEKQRPIMEGKKKRSK